MTFNFKAPLFLAVLALLTASCSTPTKFETLPESDREQLNFTASEVNLLTACRDAAQGSDSTFNEKCSKMLADKQLYAKFVDADTLGSTYKVTAEASELVTIVCHIVPSSQAAAMISKLKPMDGVYMTGPLKTLTTNEKNSPFRKRTFQQVDLNPCELKTGSMRK